MSALSKVFVALLVVCSLLLSSAVVVFVNKTEDVNRERVAAETKSQDAERRMLVAQQEAAAAKGSAVKALELLQSQTATLQTEITAKQLEISKREVEIATLSAQVSQNTISLTATAEALKASEAQKTKQETQLAEMRQGVDKLTREKSQLDLALSKTTNELDVMTREWKYAKEQLAEASNTGDKLAKQVKDLGGSPTAEVTGLKAGAPPINGVIREIKTLADNRQWATISVGSADQVAKGMEFKVIDRTSGTFLGVLTVENVQPNEAVGVLKGPKITEVKVGNEVRTQL